MGSKCQKPCWKRCVASRMTSRDTAKAKVDMAASMVEKTPSNRIACEPAQKAKDDPKQGHTEGRDDREGQRPLLKSGIHDVKYRQVRLGQERKRSARMTPATEWGGSAHCRVAERLAQALGV